jgi:hypothetical protein
VFAIPGAGKLLKYVGKGGKYLLDGGKTAYEAIQATKAGTRLAGILGRRAEKEIAEEGAERLAKGAGTYIRGLGSLLQKRCRWESERRWPHGQDRPIDARLLGPRFMLETKLPRRSLRRWHAADCRGGTLGDQRRGSGRMEALEMTPPASQDSARMLEVLGRMCDLLRAHNIDDWADSLSDFGARLQEHEEVRGDIRVLYGGAGSLNDLVFSCADRDRMIADNDEFADLRSELYRLCS